MSGLHRDVPEGQQQVRLAGPRRPDEQAVLLTLDPLQGSEVVEAGLRH